MIDEHEVTPDTLEQEDDVVEVEDTDEDEKDWQAEAQKAKELADNYKKRAEKAEKKAKEFKPESNHNKVELTQLDVIALAKSDIHEEDLERVTKFAQMEGITVRQALANDDMKAILERRAESRKVAEASNTGSTTPSRNQPSGDALLAQARSGKLPDPSQFEALFNAEKKRKK